MKKYKTKSEVQPKYKFNKGTQYVDVPPTMTGADVGAQALSGAATGAALGSAIGPWGTAIGGVVGGAAGAVKGIVAKDAAQRANSRAVAINAQSDRNMRVGVDPKLQNYQFKKGTKEIEIEGKSTPEIHTDKNYNIKNLGSVPHSKGGNKVVAAEGDIVFDTQNSKSDYNKVIRDISLYKMKGDKNAYKRLEKRRNEMPSDTNSKKAEGDGNIDLTNPHNPYVMNPDNQMLDYQTNQLTVPTNNQIGQNDLFSNENLGLNNPNPQTIPFSGIPDMGGGRSLPSDAPVETNATSKYNNLSNIGRFANIGYNTIQSFNKVQPIQQRQLELNKYKYSDMSDPLRQAIRQNRATQLYNAGRAGTSIGQQLSYAQQAQNNYVDQLGQVNARENERKQNTQNANVDLSNQENQINYQQSLQNADTMNRRRAVQQSYGAASASEVASLAETMQREKAQREAEQNFIDRQNQYLDIERTRNFGYNPDLKPEFQRTKFSKGSKSVNTKYKYKSGTKSK